MTYRLSVLDSDDTHHVMEFDDYASVVQAMLGQVPWHDKPKVMTVYELTPFEPSTWSQVAEGDEVWAPKSSTTWTVEETAAAPGGVTAYRIRNTLDPQQATTTTPQPHAEVRRRPGPASQVRQMLLDAGIATTFVRQQ